MATVNIFASFEFDKDANLKNSFYQQAKEHSSHRIRSFSLREAHRSNEWQDKAKAAISKCDLVIVLIGQDTHNASGVKVEVDIARRLGKPVFQVRPWRRTYNGVKGVKLVRWRWKRINRKIDALCGGGRR